MKKVIIAGSRTFDDYAFLCRIMDKHYPKRNIHIICGGARGADLLGKKWAQRHSLPFTLVIPDWQRHGKAAGFNRNVEMASIADEAIVVWDGRSKGSEHMIRIMEGVQKKVIVIEYSIDDLYREQP